MACVPCFIIPVLLFLWHKFIQPYVLRFWNPWAVKDADGNENTEFPFKCEGGVCAFKRKLDGNNTDLVQNDPEETLSTKDVHKDSLDTKQDLRLKSE